MVILFRAAYLMIVTAHLFVGMESAKPLLIQARVPQRRAFRRMMAGPGRRSICILILHFFVAISQIALPVQLQMLQRAQLIRIVGM